MGDFALTAMQAEAEQALRGIGAGAARLRGLPQKKSGKTPSEAEIKAVSQDFEAQFLSVMLSEMFKGLKTDGKFGGGFGEKVWREQMLAEYGKRIAQSGGIGIADHITREIKLMQGGQLTPEDFYAKPAHSPVGHSVGSSAFTPSLSHPAANRPAAAPIASPAIATAAARMMPPAATPPTITPRQIAAAYGSAQKAAPPIAEPTARIEDPRLYANMAVRPAAPDGLPGDLPGHLMMEDR